ncbi:TetR/AcrR family transcriptional regulator [Mycobacterium sp. MBM]|nr:TetR/AcrR family transcriptional regulator [Mycobacterium sp. MBM]
MSVFLRPTVTPEPTSVDRIRDAAVRTLADKGVAATSLRAVAEEAGVSIGLVQHYFRNKAGLVAAVDEHVLQVFGEIIEATPVSEMSGEYLADMGSRFSQLLYEHPDLVNYVAHALVEGDRIGSVIFDGLLQISAAQGEKFAEAGLTAPDLDPVWGALNPLILRVGAMILRPHIERHLPDSFVTRSQLERWDAAVTRLIRQGQVRDPAADD